MQFLIDPQSGLGWGINGASGSTLGAIRTLRGLSGTTAHALNLRDLNVPLGNGVTSKAIAFGTAEPNALYTIFASLSYNGGAIWITNKATTGFTVNWVTATPDANQTLDWLLIR